MAGADLRGGSGVSAAAALARLPVWSFGSARMMMMMMMMMMMVVVVVMMM